ncbi:hypothetical protein DFH08DRAFT_973070 [Mycena albidolilacea]|uniref:DUF6534 domain-containing protein n=1 Tax=Mycena albidolilacea TaxID=1033008 RepID=A0AAD7ECS4_9AGAR|nr:hypothetical protein DFH08DRAFT_973070 [Mycena albidolilacea]
MSPLPPLDSITGALLIGTWASSLLYMAEILQVIFYFRNFTNDGWKLKALVTAAFSIDTISMLGDYACVYLYTVTHAGDLDYITKQNWAVPLYVITTSFVTILVQSFLAIRYWRFTNNTLLVLFLFVLILATFGTGFSCGLILVLFPALKDRNKIKVSATVWFITQVAADLIIAAALTRELLKAKSTVIKKRRKINNALNRLVALTVQTGLATAVVSTPALINFLINPATNISVGILYSLGHTHVLCLLMNLNIRAVNENVTLNNNTDPMSSVRFITIPHSGGAGGGTSTMSAIEAAQPEIEMTTIDSKSRTHSVREI